MSLISTRSNSSKPLGRRSVDSIFIKNIQCNKYIELILFDTSPKGFYKSIIRDKILVQVTLKELKLTDVQI